MITLLCLERRLKLENNIDIEEINKNLQESFIHYDPQRVDYTVNNVELELLEQTGSTIWKDIFLASLGLGVPSLINGYCDFSKLEKESNPGIDIFTNFLVGGIAICLCIICLIVWQKNSKSFKKQIQQIKNKPKYKLPGQKAHVTN